MDYKELATKSIADLQKMLLEKREALRNFRFSTSGGKIKNVKEGKMIKKTIAQIMTAMRVVAKNVK